MVKDKKPKINKMEILRRILDNPFDPKIKKLISKNDENLETIRRKLSGKSSESLDKQSADLKPTIIVHGKEEKISRTKQFEVSKQYSDREDLIEVEKVEITEPEFVEIKSEEKVKKIEPEKKLEEEKVIPEIPELEKTEEKAEPQISPEKIIREETPVANKKVKIIDFKDVEKDEVYWRTKRGLLSSDKIQIYKPITIFEMWAFTFIIGVVAVSGLFLLRDWLFLNFGIYEDKFISTPRGILDTHIWFGFAFAILGLFHLAVHIFSSNNEILPKKTRQDFKSFLHSGMYIIGFARRENYQSSGKFSGRQRITYIALVYILGLAAITGFLYYIELLSFDLALVHIIPAGLSIMVLLFHFLITLRKHDTVALRCAFIDGKIPQWYARKYNPIWYKEINKKRETTIKRLPNSVPLQANNTLIKDEKNLNNAILKFALLINENPDEEDIKVITNKLQTMVSPDELKRIIELAEELDDESEDENKQNEKDEKQQNEEESKEYKESSDKY